MLTFFRHRITNAVSAGLNSKIQTVKKMATGFRNRENFKIAIYFHCGGLKLYPAVRAAVCHCDHARWAESEPFPSYGSLGSLGTAELRKVTVPAERLCGRCPPAVPSSARVS